MQPLSIEQARQLTTIDQVQLAQLMAQAAYVRD